MLRVPQSHAGVTMWQPDDLAGLQDMAEQDNELVKIVWYSYLASGFADRVELHVVVAANIGKDEVQLGVVQGIERDGLSHQVFARACYVLVLHRDKTHRLHTDGWHTNVQLTGACPGSKSGT